jgi:three-Cys-motif partner protein
MVAKKYPWEDGAKLEEHTKRKHKILREYFARYLAVRCAFPAQTKFRLAIVEGFAGGGRYACGTPGSPLIFIEELRAATEAFNLKRQSEGMATLDIECFMILNDAKNATVEFLKTHVEPVLAAVKAEVPRLHLHVEYRSQPFEAVYLEIKALLAQGRTRMFCSISINAGIATWRDQRSLTSWSPLHPPKSSTRSLSHRFLLF